MVKPLPPLRVRVLHPFWRNLVPIYNRSDLAIAAAFIAISLIAGIAGRLVRSDLLASVSTVLLVLPYLQLFWSRPAGLIISNEEADLLEQEFGRGGEWYGSASKGWKSKKDIWWFDWPFHETKICRRSDFSEITGSRNFIARLKPVIANGRELGYA